MKKIKLTQNKFALVDDVDYEWLNQFKWYTLRDGHTFYARCKKNGKEVQMHREILELKKGNNKQTDHIDGNGLNNQRDNLRVCTKQENQRNQRPVRGGSSKFKGVYLSKSYPKYGIKSVWRANIGKDGKAIFLGGFENEIDAAKAYDGATLKYFGKFAHVNFPAGLRDEGCK